MVQLPNKYLPGPSWGHSHRGMPAPATLPAGFTGSRRGCETTGFPSAGWRHAPTALQVASVSSLISSTKCAHVRRPLIHSPPGPGSLVSDLGKRDGLEEVPPHPTDGPHRLLGGRAPVAAAALGGCACLLATVPCPLSLLGRRGLPENEPLFPSPAASSCPRRAARQTKAEPDAMGRRLGLLPSSRSRSNPAGRQADRRMPALGEWAGTPLFLAASASPPPSFRGPKIRWMDRQNHYDKRVVQALCPTAPLAFTASL